MNHTKRKIMCMTNLSVMNNATFFCEKNLARNGKRSNIAFLLRFELVRRICQFFRSLYT